ncbi:MAG: 2TM domain-containing protein [Cyanobacteriota bacterium]
MTQYSQADVERILTRALSQRAQTETFTAQDLQEMASELGISQDVLEQAIHTEQPLESTPKPKPLLNEKHRKHRAKIRQTGIQYLMIGVFLALINLFTAGRITWAVFPILGMGLGWGLKATSSVEELKIGCKKGEVSC